MSDSVLTLIAGTGFAEPWPGVLSVASQALRRLGATLAPIDWLAPDRAVDIPFAGLDPDQAESAVRVVLRREVGDLAVDLLAQPQARRRKRLLIADMESTIIANEMLDEVADLLGLGPHIADVTRRAMNGELDFAAALRERVALLRGVPATALGEVARRIRLNPGARELVATMRAAGAYTALVSGGFRSFTSLVKAQLGFDLEVANELLISGTQLSGEVREPILGREAKLATLSTLASSRGLALADTLAVGDGANDLPMINAAGLGIAFHGKPRVIEQARHRIDHGDLTALLFVQGYRESEVKRGTG
jgi:phosphoserine phosphatase